eukprot:SAG25_NODE_1131_length_3849_cov_109.947822_4_plen_225_part_00
MPTTVGSVGPSIVATRVICTLPLALLQADQARSMELGGASSTSRAGAPPLFWPPLPAPSRDAIARLGSGQAAKVFLRFEKAFWPAKMSFLFTSRDSQLFWRPAEGHGGLEARSSDTEDGTTLVAYFAGRSCLEATRMGRAATISRTLADLDAIFAPVQTAALLLEARVVEWSRDPWSGMAYSFDPVGSTGLRRCVASCLAAVASCSAAVLTEIYLCGVCSCQKY